MDSGNTLPVPSRPSNERRNGLLALLERIRSIDPGHQQVSLAHVLEAAGRNSFGALILLAGLVTVAPLVGDIPGVPTLMALLVVISVAQLFAGRNVFWLPRLLTERSLSRRNLDRALRGCAPVARFLDRLCRRRLVWAVRGPGRYLAALIGLVIALMMPAMEFIPFSATGAGMALSMLGLAILEDDGLFVLLAILFIATTLTLIGLFFF